jgi:hypothetical protein
LCDGRLVADPLQISRFWALALDSGSNTDKRKNGKMEKKERKNTLLTRETPSWKLAEGSYGDSARQRLRHDDLPAASNESSRVSEVWLVQNVGCLRKLIKRFGAISSDGVLLRASAKNSRCQAKWKRKRKREKTEIQFASPLVSQGVIFLTLRVGEYTS